MDCAQNPVSHTAANLDAVYDSIKNICREDVPCSPDEKRSREHLREYRSDRAQHLFREGGVVCVDIRLVAIAAGSPLWHLEGRDHRQNIYLRYGTIGTTVRTIAAWAVLWACLKLPVQQPSRVEWSAPLF